MLYEVITFIDDARFPKLVYTPVMAWMLESPQTARLEVDAMFAFINNILGVNSSGTLKPHKLKLTFAKPLHAEKYLEVFGVVITSYSIHYTKLYDMPMVMADRGFMKEPKVPAT